MDQARETIWSQLLLERQVVQQGHLQHLMQERNQQLQQGQHCTLATLLVQKRWLDPNRYGALRNEVEGRGRLCNRCNTPFLSNGTTQCPRCGSGEARGLQGGGAGSGRFAAQPGSGFPAGPGSGGFPAQGSSGRFARPPSSGAFTPPQGIPSPGYGGGSGSYAAPGGPATGHFGGSGSYAAPGGAVGGPVGGPATGHFGGSGSYAAPGGFAGSGSYAAPGFAGSGSYAAPGGFAGSGSYAAPGGAMSGYGTGQFPGAAFSNPQSGRFQQVGSTGFDVEGDSFDSGELGVGKRIGRYEVVDELGRGGMGVVYKARLLDQPQVFVAIKVLLAGEFASERLKERFKAEAQICQKLRHENIVAVHDVGEVDGLLYYAMDYVQGQELQDMIRSKSLPIRRGVEILVEVAHAAHHAHENGVVHRDLKPSNILVGQDGKAYIMDFGLAKNLESDKGLTKSGVAIGTPYYMPPEQARGNHREMDARSDVYALGAILYEIVTRRVPFTAKTQNELLRKIIEEEAQPPRTVRAGVPPELEVICLKSLAKEKTDRYDSARAIAEDLERFLSGEPILAKPPPFWKPMLRRFKRNKSSTAIVAGAAVAVILALMIVFKLHAEYKRDVALREKQQEEERKKREAEEALRLAAQKKKEEAQSLREEQRAKLSNYMSAGQEAWSDARRALTTGDARTAYRRALEAYESAISCEKNLDGVRASTRYRIGEIRRALCRWTRAREDFLTATKLQPGTHQARAHLAAGLIQLRVEADRRASRASFQGAKAAKLPELDAKEQREEEIAEAVAQAYLAYLDKGYEPARRLLQDLLSGTLPRAMAGEVHGALTYLEVQEGAALGGDDHASRGLRPSEQARGNDRFRYTYLVDRAIVLARNPKSDPSALEEARKAAQDARNLDVSGELAQLAEATVLAATNQYSRVDSALQAAANNARRRSPQAASAVRLYGEGLRAAITKQRERDSKPANKPLSKDFEVAGTFNGSNGKLTAKNIAPILIQVGPDVEGILFEAETGRLGLDLDLLLYPGQYRGAQDLQKALRGSPWVANTDSATETLFVSTKSTPGLRPGVFTLLVLQPPTSRQKIQAKIKGTFFRKGQALPFRWQDPPGLKLPQQLIPRAQAAMRQLQSGDVEGAIKSWKALEASAPSVIALKAHRVKLLLAANKTQEAVALARDLTKAKTSDPLALLETHVFLISQAIEAGKHQEAEKLLLTLRKLHPDQVGVQAVLAANYRASKKPKRALALAEEALSKAYHPRLAVQAALAEAALGKPDLARKRVEAIAADPTVGIKDLSQACQFLRQDGQAELVAALVAAAERRGQTRFLSLSFELALAWLEVEKFDQALQSLAFFQGKLRPGAAKQRLDALIREIQAGKAKQKK